LLQVVLQKEVQFFLFLGLLLELVGENEHFLVDLFVFLVELLYLEV